MNETHEMMIRKGGSLAGWQRFRKKMDRSLREAKPERRERFTGRGHEEEKGEKGRCLRNLGNLIPMQR